MHYLVIFNLPYNTDIEYFKGLTIFFLLYHNCIFENNAIFIQQQKAIPKVAIASRMLSDLYLYFYERMFNNNNLLYRYINDIITFSLNDNLTIYISSCSLYS